MAQEQTAAASAPNTADATEENAPKGTTAPEDLFDFMGAEGKKFKKTGPPKPATAAKKPEPKKWAAGMPVWRHGHNLALPKDMTEAEIFAWLREDMFPELSRDRAELRHDKDKDRLYFVDKAYKKGAGR